MNVDLVALLSKLCNDVQSLTEQDQNSGYGVWAGGPVAMIEPGVCSNQRFVCGRPLYRNQTAGGSTQNLAGDIGGELVGRKPETEQDADKVSHCMQWSRSAVDHTAHVSSHWGAVCKAVRDQSCVIAKRRGRWASNHTLRITVVRRTQFNELRGLSNLDAGDKLPNPRCKRCFQRFPYASLGPCGRINGSRHQQGARGTIAQHPPPSSMARHEEDCKTQRGLFHVDLKIGDLHRKAW